MTSKARPQLNMRIEEELQWKLDQLSKRLGVNQSAVIRLAVTELAQRKRIPEWPAVVAHEE